MLSNVQIERHEGRVVDGVGTPKDFVLERDLWLYGKGSPTSDMVQKPTASDIVRSNIYEVCQARERPYGEL